MIFDDFGGDSKDKAAFPCEHLIEISNPTGDVKVHVPGDTRYTPIFFAANSSRTIIWLCNDLPDWIDKPAVQARFNVLILPDNYRWKAPKGSGQAGDPICLDEDEEMPPVKPEPESKDQAEAEDQAEAHWVAGDQPHVVRPGRVHVRSGEPERKKRRIDFGLECEDCLTTGEPCMVHAM